MKKRIGIISIVIYNIEKAKLVNSLLSEYFSYILSRNGLPLKDKNVHIINVVIQATMNDINSLTGKLGRIEDVEVKCLLTKIEIADEGEIL